MHLIGLERIQNITVRQIARQPWYIRNRTIRKDLRLPTIQEYFKRIAERLFKKTDASSNAELLNISSYDPRGNRNRRRPRAALGYLHTHRFVSTGFRPVCNIPL
ncbi:hypothetical protein AVEN_230869-1 [Araneus ventricosus]|uniref:Uncharacterized protein n=1 Tax=Araneus ventricosus TaxID=182803 RepID=A0A4Y2A2C2_ARAVE|nr:hypothetical protein AVEN_230869-1 [Araneus ventricosus]